VFFVYITLATMEMIPIQTDVLRPPKDDLTRVLKQSLTNVQEKDIILITSKVVSIHQGDCVPAGEVEKEVLVMKEAEAHIPSEHPAYSSPLTIKHHALFFASGIDESNGNGHYILLPKDPFAAAQNLWRFIRNCFGVHDVGVIITDSHSLPLRYGVMGVSIAFCGFQPVVSHKGKRDLFGREIRLSSTNIVDGLAAAGGVVCGECDETTPVVIARGVPGVVFTENDTREELLIPPQEDLYYPLLKKFYGD